MRILAVDPGSVRVGLAVSDDTGTLASPLATVPAGPDLALRLSATARERGAARVVIGLPRRLDGSEGDEAAAARRLAAELEATGATVELWDERMTSRIAERSLAGRPRPRDRRAREKRRAEVDAVAAAVLLQSYLDRTPSASSPR